MIKISKSGNAILVEGLDNVFYPNNGKITYPSNSIILTLDKSNMATFRSAANNDVLFSGLIEDITIAGSAVTKDNIVTNFGAVAYAASGGGGGTGAVSSVNGQTGDVVITAASIDAAPNSELTAVKNRVGVNEKNIANNTGAISTLQTNMLGKQETLVSGTNIKTIGGESILGSGNIIEKEPAFEKWKTSGNIAVGESSTAGGTSVSIGKNSTSSLNSVSVGAYSNSEGTLDGSAIGAYSEVTNNHEIALGAYNKSINTGTDADKTHFTIASHDASSTNKKNSLEIRRDNSIYIWKDDAQVKLQDQLGGGTVTETDPVFTAWKNSSNIVLGEDANGTNDSISIGMYSTATNGGIGVGTSTNGRLGGVAIGRNATASTAAVSIGQDSIADGSNSISIGGGNSSARNSFSVGQNSLASNENEIGIGSYNNSVNSGDDTVKTHFSISSIDATSSNRKNSFEIRNNNDIYIWKGSDYVKLQDQLGGGSGGGVTSVNGKTGDVTLSIPTVQTTNNGTVDNYIYSDENDSDKRVMVGLTYDDTTNDKVSFDYYIWGGSRKYFRNDFPMASSTKAGAITAADKIKLDSIPTMSVLTQAEYDALATKDANTLYFIKEG